MKDETIQLLAAHSKLVLHSQTISGLPGFNQEEIIFYQGKGFRNIITTISASPDKGLQTDKIKPSKAISFFSPHLHSCDYILALDLML